MASVNEIFENLCLKVNFHSKRKLNKIVLLRLDALGDFIIWQDSAKEFKRKYPQMKIVVVCQESIAEFARTLPYFDEVCAINLQKMQKALGYFIIIFLKLWRYRGATLIQMVYSRTWLMNVIVSMIPAYKKITVDGNCDNFPMEKGHYDDIYDSIKHISSKWNLELTRNAMYMRKLGFGEMRSDLPTLPEYSLGNKKIHEEYYVIILGTGTHGREWRPDYYGEIARYIYIRYQLKCCLLGIEKDKVLVDSFRVTYGDMNPYVDMLGRTSVSEYIQLIREAKLVISGDTSAAHIAAAVRTKCVVIIGGWHYGRFFPYSTEKGIDKEYFPRVCNQYMACYRCNRKWVTKQCRWDEKRTGYWSCMLAVKPEIVIKEVETVLLEGKGK